MKPAGLATIPGRGETDSVLERLASQLGLPDTGQTDPRLRVVHRLDKPTSGVLLFAKNIEAQRHLSHQFQNNVVAKEYLAIVIGTPASDTGQIDAPLAANPSAPQRMMISESRGRPARTLWQIEDRLGPYAGCAFSPRPGRRIKFASTSSRLGWPWP